MVPILEIQNLFKQYQIQHLSGGYLSLREKMLSLLRFERTTIDEFWALKDVSFDVQPGESLGIIGPNGAGKSTLLKILSKITPLTKGRIISRGRIACLLEVGTGFHPELTGRENIYFNGSLLGMKRKEIDSKFDEIVDFSGTERFLDTPLKHYSSGMQLRLAFAVAAFLEPEILIIDEVLAVGDTDFQKKCIGKMEDVSKSGRTILFVSHDLEAVEKLCPKSILLKEGSIEMIDSSALVIDRYVHHKHQAFVSRPIAKDVNLTKFDFGNDRIISGSQLTFDIEIHFEKTRPVITDFCILIYTLRGYRVAIVDLRHSLENFVQSGNSLSVKGSVSRVNLVEGEYQMGLYFGINYNTGEVLDLARITVSDNQNTQVKRYQPQYRGVVELDFKIHP